MCHPSPHDFSSFLGDYLRDLPLHQITHRRHNHSHLNQTYRNHHPNNILQNYRTLLHLKE